MSASMMLTKRGYIHASSLSKKAAAGIVLNAASIDDVAVVLGIAALVVALVVAVGAAADVELEDDDDPMTEGIFASYADAIKEQEYSFD